MSTFDRYLLSQLAQLFGFFSLVLVGIYWINQAVLLFDRLIAGGHAGVVFLEFTVLTLPNVIRLVLPVSAFAAAVYVANRLRGESELVVMQAMGLSPLRLARPLIVFGAIGAALTLALTLKLAPLAEARLGERTAEIAQDVTAGLLTEGEFLHPTEGVTFYIREITPETVLAGVFLADARTAGRETIYTGREAILVRHSAGPRLVMFDGMVQEIDGASGRLAITRFEEFAYDISGFVEMGGPVRRDIDAVPTRALLSPGAALAEETGESVARLGLEPHLRLAQGATVLMTPLLGFSILLLGGFSRFGAWRQIGLAIAALVVLDLGRTLAADVATGTPEIWPVVYLPPLAGLAAAFGALALAARPKRITRTPSSLAEAPT